jgi:uncharacterized protein YqgV (UPF0045/DUF77 family)
MDIIPALDSSLQSYYIIQYFKKEDLSHMLHGMGTRIHGRLDLQIFACVYSDRNRFVFVDDNLYRWVRY